MHWLVHYTCWQDHVTVMGLIALPIVKIHRRIEKDECVRLHPQFEYIPSLVRIFVGNLNAESFNERIISVLNQVMTTDNTLLSSKSVERLGILRINRDFMAYMRDKYPKLVDKLST